jgi:hypothetical protein
MEYLISKYPVLFIVLVLNIVLMVFTIFKTMNSALHKDTKLAIYILVVVAPVLGTILYFFLAYRSTSSNK